jgi:outer membrane protein assembly factor BamB
MRASSRWFLACLVIVLVLANTRADWLNFRGPKNSGLSAVKGLPVTWSEKENLVWKTQLPGPGGSSPIISGDRVLITCYTGYGIPGADQDDQKDLKRHLLCIDRKKGTILWDKALAAKLPETTYRSFITLHGYASSTPATDGKKVYVFYGKSGVFAYDFKGKQVWHADVGNRTDGWGSATSPLLYKDLVIINASVESGALIALHKKDGKQAWKCPGIGRAWNSPVLVDVDGGKQEVVVRVPRSILGIDPATGKKLWHFDGFGDSYVCPTVVAKGGIVYSLGGRFRGEAAAVKAGGKGDVTETHKVWTKSLGIPIPSPVLFRDHLYWVSDDGSANCFDAKNGEEVYSKRLEGSGTLYASITIADGKIYAVARNKGMYVLAAGPKFQLLAHNKFESDTSIFNGSPAVSNGQLFLRSDKYLYCVGKK